MNDVRINKSEENGLIQIRHMAPWYFYVLCIGIPCALWLESFFGVILTRVQVIRFSVFLPLVILLPGVIAIAVVETIFINKVDYCQLTDRRLIVFAKHIFSHKHQTYRLDQINDVEIHSVLGVKSIVLRVTQGNNLDKKLVLRFVRNGRGAYNYLCGLLANQKNNTDALCELLNKGE